MTRTDRPEIGGRGDSETVIVRYHVPSRHKPSRFALGWRPHMSDRIRGVVQDGKIIPQTPLPDGLQVEIMVPEQVIIAEELQGELDAWSLGNAEALAMVEQLAEEMGRHEEG